MCFFLLTMHSLWGHQCSSLIAQSLRPHWDPFINQRESSSSSLPDMQSSYWDQLQETHISATDHPQMLWSQKNENESFNGLELNVRWRDPTRVQNKAFVAKWSGKIPHIFLMGMKLIFFFFFYIPCKKCSVAYNQLGCTSHFNLNYKKS